MAGVRIVVRTRSHLPEGWAMAIIFNTTRVDGIDWERRVEDHRGKAFDCTGWHRLIWKIKGGALHKECLPKFNPGSKEDFLRSGFALLNVRLERGGDDERNLFGH